ncbi:trypsin-like serine protease [Halobacteriovorax sp. GB3]|uniref:trypsin-like serine protease n=1 Tax=Halobacteriovorax sp. GB3 TaxID=2719615 RepID=UPI00235EB098|nr:trypsin-like serine protease [Halobacteriovorax sp. GB3]MDD0853197.1 trypsin-like serine protease [Halobacteriovorax sp. GB3]
MHSLGMVITFVFAVTFISCGKQNVNSNDFVGLKGGIIHGKHVDESSYLFSARLLKNYDSICGAVYLGKKTLLTAAHCLENLWPDETQILIQDQIYEVEDFLFHPDYEDDSSIRSENDLAIIKLYKAPMKDQLIIIAKEDLDIRELNKSSDSLFVLGTGHDENGNKGQLKKKFLKVKEKDFLCQFNHLDQSLISGIDLALGDSGNGLFYTDGRNTFILGINSGKTYEDEIANQSYFKKICHRSFYSDLRKHRDWIEKNI